MDQHRKHSRRGLLPLSLLLLLLTHPEAFEEDMIKRDDLLVVMPTSHQRIPLVVASRSWRKGVRTYIVSDRPGIPEEEARLHRETWGTYKDIENSALDVGPRQGDLRAAMAVFLANRTLTSSVFKWILYGDDDTVFFIDNILRVLNSAVLDYRHPYLVSDCLWWGSHEAPAYTKLHPSRMAPRCLPCGYEDPLLDRENRCEDHEGFIAPPSGCPCSPGQLFRGGRWPGGDPDYMGDGRGIFDRQHGDFVHRPGAFHSPAVGWWYMIHGGAGALISRQLMDMKSFGEVEAYMKSIPSQSGDAMVTKAFWYVFGTAPTDPGYGYCRDHIQMFDPGWRGPRSRGPEDAGTADAGADPLGMLQRLEWGVAGLATEWVRDQLDHTLTVHVRARHAADDWLDGSELGAADDPDFRAASFIIERLAELGSRWAARSKAYVPLWPED